MSTMWARRASVTLGALVLTLTAACSAEEEPAPEPTAPPVVVEMPGADPTEPAATAAPAPETPESTAAPQPASVIDDEILEHGGEITFPAGMDAAAYNAQVHAASAAARKYLETRYASAFDDPDYDGWLAAVDPMATDAWHATLTGELTASGGSEHTRTQRERERASYHVQTMESPLLAYGEAMEKGRVVLDVPFRMWETSTVAGDRAPFDTRQSQAGLEGTQWTRMVLVEDEATGAWLVDSEDVAAVEAGMFE